LTGKVLKPKERLMAFAGKKGKNIDLNQTDAFTPGMVYSILKLH